MLEVGRAQRTIFLARYLRDRELQRETNAGLNVVENYNGVNDYIHFGKSGELACNRREEQELSISVPANRRPSPANSSGGIDKESRRHTPNGVLSGPERPSVWTKRPIRWTPLAQEDTLPNKAQFVELLTERLDGDKKKAQAALDAVIDTIYHAVAKGERVVLTGFGIFEKRDRAARTARNPATGASVKVKKTTVPAFRAGAEFKAITSGAKKLAKAPAKKAAAATKAPATKAAATKAPATKAPATKAPATKAPATKASASKAPATKAAAKTPATTASAKKAPAKAR